ncbi:DUF72 domain-containing protein [Pelomonas sp. KK5]|uniref:DUF72 domain-containing protein n=1 Tax=Pelomonas sp. KK5 TaxID=1855730 RepID=UPI00097C7B21|nr:DUF72 domain-containing protein [Pelomonas sp. KK5]
MRVRVGTASWTDKTLIDSRRFYPPQARNAEQRLRFYSTQFPIVEVDSSYYAMPSATNAQHWVERTPRGFVMNIKAFRLMTGHQTSPDALPADMRQALPPALAAKKNLYAKDVPGDMLDELFARFRAAIEPLRLAGKLGLVHFQFAPWVLRAPKDIEHVRYCVEQMRGYQVSIEFRNSSWFTPEHVAETLALLRDLDVTNTTVDEPQGFTNSIPTVWDLTNDRVALLRLHGRNHETWNIKGATAASDRFNYDYTRPELEALAEGIRRIGGAAGEVNVIFNNNYEDQGQRNARTLMEVLGEDAVKVETLFFDGELPF